jgi:hypothetical protein
VGIGTRSTGVQHWRASGPRAPANPWETCFTCSASPPPSATIGLAARVVHVALSDCIMHTSVRKRQSVRTPSAAGSCVGSVSPHEYDMQAAGPLDSAANLPHVVSSPARHRGLVPGSTMKGRSGARVEAAAPAEPTADEPSLTAHGTLKPMPRRGRLGCMVWRQSAGTDSEGSRLR